MIYKYCPACSMDLRVHGLMVRPHSNRLCCKTCDASWEVPEKEFMDNIVYHKHDEETVETTEEKIDSLRARRRQLLGSTVVTQLDLDDVWEAIGLLSSSTCHIEVNTYLKDCKRDYLNVLRVATDIFNKSITPSIGLIQTQMIKNNISGSTFTADIIYILKDIFHFTLSKNTDEMTDRFSRVLNSTNNKKRIKYYTNELKKLGYYDSKK